MKHISFRKELIPLVQSGKKTQTRRTVSYGKCKNGYPGFAIRRYKEGDIFVVKESQYKRETHGYIKINKVRLTDIASINEEDAIAEGFKSIDEFMETWRKIHGNDFGEKQALWKVEFTYLKDYEPERGR